MSECQKKPVTLYSNDILNYLQEDAVIDFNDIHIMQLSNRLWEESSSELNYIQRSYEYVRDQISHSADIGMDVITCAASEVLEAGHGICFAKSHLLAALLRCRGIPAGFCYQKILLEDKTDSVLVYHGLNGVFVRELQRWIRLDARGNKNGVDAQFSLEKERLAFSIRSESGECDGLVVYPIPDKNIVKALSVHKTRTELWKNLPTDLAYPMA